MQKIRSPQAVNTSHRCPGTLLATLTEPLSRWWRSRGHGVHSPFAYRFIRGVLREKTQYYNYGEIDRLGGDTSWHRLLFRLVCEFEPEQLLATHLSVDERTVIRLADSRVSMSPDAPLPDNLPPGVMELRGKVTVAMVIRDIRSDGHRWNNLLETLHAGMTFTNGTVGIVVERPGLPRQDFRVNF